MKVHFLKELYLLLGHLLVIMEHPLHSDWPSVELAFKDAGSTRPPTKDNVFIDLDLPLHIAEIK